ncbi:AMP-binding protein [Actinomadura madurae]|nr:AMP-binding protein [Actinomadura madurae]
MNIVIGSTRPSRVGATIAEWVLQTAESHGRFDADLVDLTAMGLPLLDEPNHPREADYQHGHTLRWSEQVASADAFVFVTPEYNYGAPPALINAIDYLFHEWQYKPVGFVSYGGVSAGTRSVQMLKQIVTTVKMMPVPEAVSIPFFPNFIEQGVYTPDDIAQASASAMYDELIRWTIALEGLGPARSMKVPQPSARPVDPRPIRPHGSEGGIPLSADSPPSMPARIPFNREHSSPRASCIRAGDRALDNADFAEVVRRATGRFEGLGVDRGDTVAVLLPNCTEIVTVMFAAWCRGAAMTPINPNLTDDEVRYQLRDSRSVVVVGGERARALASSVDASWVDAETLHRDDHEPPIGPGRAVPPAAEASDIALVIYTSGTTGRPKGVLLDHANLDAMSASLVEHFELTGADRSLLVLPLFHVNGLVVSVLSPLRAGGNVVVAPRFSPDTFWDLVEANRPTFFSAVPTVYSVLDTHTERAVDTSSLRFAICGAAPAPSRLLTRFEERFGVPVVEGYGLSEGSVASTVNPVAGPRKPGTVGVALPGQEVLVVSDDGTPQPPGERGEVIVRGSNVMRGYLGRPEETAAVLRAGWLHTGDVGVLDEDGYLRIVDRIKDMIIRGGENIYPKEIEECLHRHPGVVEAAVVGKPDVKYGEVPVAFVAARPGSTVTAEELLEHCAASLARYKTPTEIHVRDQLPKNSVGKLVKSPLREAASARVSTR